MTVIVKQIYDIDEISDFFVDYLAIVHNITNKEKIEQLTTDLRQKFDEGKRTVFVAYQEKSPIGFISGNNEKEVFETIAFYIKKVDNIEDCGYKLITSLANKAFEMGSKFYRQSITLPANFEHNLEDSLRKEGYYIYPRVGMILQLNKEEKLATTLPDNYYFEPF